MKKMTPVVLACIIGCSLAFIIYKRIESDTFIKDTNNVVAIQLGVFNDSKKAEALKKKLGGRTFKEGDLYRVYYAILNNDDNIKFMTEYLDKKGISYYLKSLSVDEEALKDSLEFERVMLKTKDASKLDINEQILKIYEGVII